jgi:hypothetical protein
MGYQVGTVKLSTGRFEEGIIFNGSTFCKRDEIAAESATRVAEAAARQYLSSLTVVNVNLIPRSLETLRGVQRVWFSTLTGKAVINASESAKPAKDSPIILTASGEDFMRFSAYENDIRITEKRGLTPGTFGTTAEDGRTVKTGREAVARYALENKKSANKRFTITPPKDTEIRQGIVAPAYGEPGGGVEVIFVNGTPDATVSQPDILPEE